MGAVARAEKCALWRQAHRDQGLCTSCDNKARPEGALCEECLKKKAFNRQRGREERDKTGTCACGAKREAGHKQCTDCLACKRAKSGNRHHGNKAAGHCAVCGKNKPKRGCAQCAACIKRGQRYKQERERWEALEAERRLLADQRKFELRRRLHNPACVERLAKLIQGQAHQQRGGTACSQIS